MENKKSIIDFYLDNPLWADFILISLLIVGNYISPVLFTLKYEASSQLNILSSLIGTSVSLAGFILAALTIIVAFKSNIASKPANEASNPLELLFSTGNYSKIIKVFKDAIIELTVAFVLLYVVWILIDNLPVNIILHANIYIGFLIFFSIVRTLFVLFLVLTLDTAKED